MALATSMIAISPVDGESASAIDFTAASSDVSAPLVSVSSPANWSSVAAPVVVSGSSSDDTGVSSVVLEIFDRDTGEWWDGSAWQAARSSFDASLDAAGEVSSGWAYSFDPGSVSSEPYWVTVRSFDAAGNASAYSYTNFTVLLSDVSAPLVSVSCPANWSSVAAPVVVVGVVV